MADGEFGASLRALFFENHENTVPRKGGMEDTGTVKAKLPRLLFNECMADFHFIIVKTNGLKERLPVHRLILAMGSPVFYSTFYGDLRIQEDEMMVPPDEEPDALRAVIKFIYTEEIDINADTVLPTLYSARKYALPELESACLKYLEEELNPQNVFSILPSAKLYDVPKLIEDCLRIIENESVECFAADNFVDVKLDILCLVLERNWLDIDELNVFQGALRWANEECKRQNLPSNAENQRQVLGRAIYLIRFPLITAKEMAETVAPSLLLNNEEICEMYRCILLQGKPIETFGFSNEPRFSNSKVIAAKRSIIKKYSLGHRGNYDSSIFATSFGVDRKIFLHGCGVYGSKVAERNSRKSLYVFDAEGFQIGVGRRIIPFNGTSRSDRPNGKHCFNIFLDTPIEIKPCMDYVLSINSEDAFVDNLAFGTKNEVVKVQDRDRTVNFRFLKVEYNSDCENYLACDTSDSDYIQIISEICFQFC